MKDINRLVLNLSLVYCNDILITHYLYYDSVQEAMNPIGL